MSAGAGLALILATYLDIIVIVLHPQRESRLSVLFNRVIWMALHAAARRAPATRRHAILAWGIPLMIGGLIALWIALLIVGFALVYYPWIGSREHFILGDSPGNQVADALYMSAASLATIGYGDLTPLSTPFRALGVLEGISGIVVITMSVTYLLTIYPSIQAKNALAEDLHRETAGRPSGLAMIERYLRIDASEALAQRLSDVNVRLLDLAEAHRSHSVLYYSHTIEPERTLARLLVTVRGLVATLRFGMRTDSPVGERRPWLDPRVLALESTFVYVLRTLGESVHVRVDGGGTCGEEQREELCRAYGALRSELHAMGLAPDCGTDAREEYIQFRLGADLYLDAYRRHAGYTTEELEGETPPPTFP